MPGRRRSTFWVAGILGGAVVGTAIWYGFGFPARPRGTASATGGSSVTIGQASTQADAEPGAAGQRPAGPGDDPGTASRPSPMPRARP